METTITREQYEATLAEVAKVNARAAKKGLSGEITFTGTPTMVTVKDELTGIERTYEMMHVVLSGNPLKYQGWTFVATLDWDENAGLVVRTAPGVETVDRSGLREGFCDHCKTNRYRKETYLLTHEDGRQVQVGSTCIKDFLGLQVGISWLDTGSISAGFGVGSWARDNGTEYVLALAWALIKLDGYKPASASSSTKGDVFQVLYPPKQITPEYREWAGRVRALAVEAVERAAEVRAFILSDDFSGESEYVRNLKAIAAAEYVSDKNVGILVSAPQAWARHLERTLIREKETEAPSEWVGSVGDKLMLTATIRGVRFIEGDWGTTVLYTLKGQDGNLYKWFASREALGDETGVEVTIRATVKGHEEFRGMKETVLTRAKAV